MHTRNIFQDAPPDFTQLAVEFPSLAPFIRTGLSGKPHINFQDAQALRELSKALLQKHFGIVIDIPLDRLIPTIPLRLNYIHWIEDLVAADTARSDVCGIDVGCGASCVYPLLGYAMHKWRCYASELDNTSLEYAIANVEKNEAQSHITVIPGQEESLLAHIFLREGAPTAVDFTMCNPPFFKELNDDNDRRALSDERLNVIQRQISEFVASQECEVELSPKMNSFERRHAHAVAQEHGLEHESCGDEPNRRIVLRKVTQVKQRDRETAGGEVEFVTRMITESLQLRTKVTWYTSMIGVKASLKPLMKVLKEHDVPVVTTTVFNQGRTRRWGLAWSFHLGVKKPADDKSSGGKKKRRPFLMTVGSIVACQLGKWQLAKRLFDEFNGLDLEADSPQRVLLNGEVAFEIRGRAHKNTWKHERRRRRMRDGITKLISPQATDNLDTGTVLADKSTTSLRAANEGDESPSSEGTLWDDIRQEKIFEVGRTIGEVVSKKRTSYFDRVDGERPAKRAACDAEKSEGDDDVEYLHDNRLGGVNQASDANEGNDTNGAKEVYDGQSQDTKEETIIEQQQLHKEVIDQNANISAANGSAGNPLVLDSPTKEKVKTSFPEYIPVNTPASEICGAGRSHTPMFEFTCQVGDSEQMDVEANSLVVSLACVDGDRDQLYSLYTYLKNKLEGAQVFCSAPS